MIGKACVSLFQYYDSKTRTMKFKGRPILIIGQADPTDYVVLPISTVSDPTKIDSEYDLQLLPSDVPKMNFKTTSYVRTHKQTVIHAGEVSRQIVDFKAEYEDLYLQILAKVEKFQKEMLDKAL